MASVSFSDLKPSSKEDINVLANIKNTVTNKPSGAYNPSLFYKIDPSSWYETFPFSFDIRESGSSGSLKDGPFQITDIPGSYIKCRFFLPIPPQNYTIQDMSTSEAHATIGGVVEEINSPVFSMITLVGTTGLSLNSPNVGDGIDKDLLTVGRKYIDEVESSKLGKLLKNIAFSAINNILLEQEDQLQYQNSPSAVNTPQTTLIDSMFKDANVDSGNFFEKMASNFVQTFEGKQVPKNEFSNGWAWSQALRQFFLIFQRERSKNPNLELYFVDHKSRAHYRCVPRSVQFQQNSNMPYLINYTIILKCWQIQDVSDIALQAKKIDRFNGDLKEVATASITGIVSKVGKLTNSLNRFPSVAGSFVRNSTGSFL